MVDKKVEDILNTKDTFEIQSTDKDGKTSTQKIRNNIMRPAKDAKAYEKRWNFIHKFVKGKLIHTGIKIVSMILGKYLIKSLDDIPKDAYNNMQRIMYHSYVKGIEVSHGRIWYDFYIKNNIDVGGMSKDEYWEMWSKEAKSFEARMLMLNLFMTEILEDTFDRAVIDITMIEAYHQIHELYGGKVPTVKEFRIYDSRDARDIKYFFDTIKTPTWRKDK